MVEILKTEATDGTARNLTSCSRAFVWLTRTGVRRVSALWDAPGSGRPNKYYLVESAGSLLVVICYAETKGAYLEFHSRSYCIRQYSSTATNFRVFEVSSGNGFNIERASVFDEGKFPLEFITRETPFSSCFDFSAPPKPLLIATPTVNGTYPVLLLLHGFYLRKYFYKGILQHTASHGFIVVGPQFYSLVPPTGPEEIESAAKVVNWLAQGLQSLLPENVVADLTKVALSGRSRGGKEAFALALGHAKESLSHKFSVLIGIDPVAGANQSCRTHPHILTYVPSSFDLNIPVEVIGSGLGPEKKNGCICYGHYWVSEDEAHLYYSFCVG
ncbi:chlorophyllase-1-like [Argentina anserina]|uniref:chlorophyllase-1-like n=1 Tax=Argentina anserina TaxID=57926 RepID=UPI0021762217|nr:chlorophyllase-1-like [Potentilla anserina]